MTLSDTHILEVTGEKFSLMWLLCHFLSVPSPVVTVSATRRSLVSGSSLHLFCFIQPLSGDASITILSNWSTPAGREDRVNNKNDTSPELVYPV